MTDLHLIRHGDLLLVPIEMMDGLDKIPEGKELATNILAEGEVTGHHHRLTGKVQVFAVSVSQHPEITKAVKVLEDQKLVHEEHNTVAVPKGDYVLVQERELTLEQEARRVMD